MKSKYRRKHLYWEYNCDGQFSKERIKGWVKKYWKKWRRRIEQKEEN